MAYTSAFQMESVFSWLPIESMIHDRQDEYYAAINRSNAAGESTIFLGFMLSVIREALEEAVSTLPCEGTKTERRWNTIEAYLGRNDHIQSKDVQRMFGVSPATANRILSGFCESGMLQKVRYGSYWVYRLAER